LDNHYHLKKHYMFKIIVSQVVINPANIYLTSKADHDYHTVSATRILDGSTVSLFHMEPPPDL